MTIPSPRRPIRSRAWMPIAACSRAWAAPASSGPPRQTTSQARPLDKTSRLAHCWAKRTGWRCANVAMQPTPKRTFVVTVASALSNVTDSRRGLASRLSPTHTVSKAPEASPCVAKSTRSLALTAPRITARFGTMSPKDAPIMFPPVEPTGLRTGCCGLSRQIRLAQSCVSGAQRAIKPANAALPPIFGGLWAVARAVVGVKRMPGIWVDDDLDVGIVLLQNGCELAHVLRRRVLVLLPEEAEEGARDVLRDIEPRDRLRLVFIRSCRRSVPGHRRAHTLVVASVLDGGAAPPANPGAAQALGARRSLPAGVYRCRR